MTAVLEPISTAAVPAGLEALLVAPRPTTRVDRGVGELRERNSQGHQQGSNTPCNTLPHFPPLGCRVQVDVMLIRQHIHVKGLTACCENSEPKVTGKLQLDEGHTLGRPHHGRVPG